MIRLAALQAWPLFSRPDCCLDGGVEVVGAEHDERIRAAEFEHDLLALRPAICDRCPGPLRPGQRDALHARIGDGLGDLLVGGVDVDIRLAGKPAAGEDLFQDLGRLRVLRGVLEHDGVADREVGSGEVATWISG